MKSNIFKAVLNIAFVTLLGTVSVVAQSQEEGERKEPPTAEEIIKQMDTNEDGKLALDEVKGPLKDGFEKIDTDEDGFLTQKEIEAAPKPKGNRPPKK